MTWLVALAMTGALASPAPQSADDRELAKYRLTTDVLTQVEAVAKAYQANLAKDPKMKRRLDAQRELDALDAKETLTPAEQKRAHELSTIIADLEDGLELAVDAGSLAEMTAQLNRIPPMAAALKSAGMPAREMAKFLTATLHAALGSGAAENATFYKANEAAFERISTLFGVK